MTSDARIVRRDSVQFYPDRAGRLPNFVWVQQRGFLVLTEDGDQRSVVLLRDSRPPLEVDLAAVRHVGTPRGPFGSGSLGDRALRLAVGEERVIVAFTGETTDLTDSITDFNMGRLRGDVDLVSGLTAVQALWRNRAFWSRSSKPRTRGANCLEGCGRGRAEALHPGEPRAVEPEVAPATRSSSDDRRLRPPAAPTNQLRGWRASCRSVRPRCAAG